MQLFLADFLELCQLEHLGVSSATQASFPHLNAMESQGLLPSQSFQAMILLSRIAWAQWLAGSTEIPPEQHGQVPLPACD